MKKVFLVEDEYIVREGIKNRIEWEKYGFEFAGEASDGEVGLSMISKVKPDIVITDIKMPFMDGLELSRRIKDEMPDTEIIVLTGYADFNYARECLKVGVSEYLTKPIKPDEIIEALENVAGKIDERVAEEKARLNNQMKREQELKNFYSTQAQAEDNLNMNEIDIKKIDRERMLEFLKLGDSSDIDSFVEEAFATIDPGVMNSMIFRQYLVMDSYFALCDFVESIELDKSIIPAPDVESGVFLGPSNAIIYIKQIMGIAVEARDKNATGKNNSVVTDMIKYVEENYSDSELSLNAVADYIGFTPNHLSMVFSHETGQTFIKYLTNLRINKAKELLKCTSMSLGEVGEAVGYADSHYFSYIFKKNTGMTPSAYKASK